jgi:hypothetical protein
LLAVFVAAACASSSGIERKAQPDGSYRVDCRQPLTRCLTAIEEVCGAGYSVVQAREERRYLGPREINAPYVSSVVVARCGAQGGATTASTSEPAPAAASSGGEPSGPSPSTRGGCFPGATQACVGAGACRGGQQCLADGTAFGPCDCGGPAVPTAPLTPAPAPALPMPAQP